MGGMDLGEDIHDHSFEMGDSSDGDGDDHGEQQQGGIKAAFG
ncbi:MAG: hypothetical protein R2865_15820 [Deinococcales bacterium]